MLDVGDRVIDAAPPFVKEFAIDTFGTNDKPALLVGIGVFLAVYAGVVGVVALRHRFVVGAVGVGAVRGHRVVGGDEPPGRGAVARRRCRACSGPLAGIGALWLIRQSLRLGDREPTVPGDGTATDRRQFLHHSGVVLGGLAVGAALVGGLGRRLGSRFTATESRAAVALPTADRARSPACPAGRAGRRPRDDAVRHAERRLLPHRHRPHRAAGPHRGLHAADHRDGRQRARAVLRRPPRTADDRARHHADVRVQRGRRTLRRQRPLARHAPRRPAPGGRRAARRRPGRRPLGRRLRVRVPGRRRDGRARRARRGRHERRAAADRARLPRPPDRARPVRLRVGDEVADRDRADDVRRVRPLLAAARAGRSGRRSS